MQDRVAEPLGVVDVKAPGRRDDVAVVADLAALLGVEIRAVQQQARLVAGVQRAAAHDGVVLHPAEDVRGDLQADRTSANRRSSAARPDTALTSILRSIADLSS